MANLLELNKEDLEKLKQYCHNQKFNLTEEDFKNEENIMKKLNSQQYFEYRLMKKKLVEADRFDKCDVSISCNVHGMINLHPVLKNIIDTPEFQRLRRLRQLGVTYFVYPTAMHTRFEHSIGVSHLAGQLVNQLAELQPELNITKKEILCVKIAGLCHDLGHGPFSHMFERFIEKKGEVKWNHEQASCELLDIIKENEKVKKSLERCGIDETDITIIKDMIKGIKKEKKSSNGNESSSGNESPQLKEHQEKKGFLYEIVANNRFALDVDKLDYLSRDSLNLGLSLVSANFDHKRIMYNLRVNKVDGNFELCPRNKMYKSISKVFELRQQLSETAYFHKTTVAVECMLLDVMVLADTCIKKILDYSLSEIVKNLDAYCKLDDETLLSMIQTSTDDDMKSAKDLLCRIEQRDLYQLIGETVYMHDFKNNKETAEQLYKQEKVEQQLQDLLQKMEKDREKKDENVWKGIVVAIRVIHLGMKNKNPADKATYHPKIQPENGEYMETQPDLKPRYAMKEVIRVYCKEKRAGWNQETHDKRVDAFIEWCKDRRLPTPKKSGQSLKRKAAATSESDSESESDSSTMEKNVCHNDLSSGSAS